MNTEITEYLWIASQTSVMPKFWFLLLKRAAEKVALNYFMLLLSLKLLKKESGEQLAALKNFMAVQQPARGFTSSLLHSPVNYFLFFSPYVRRGFLLCFVLLFGGVFFLWWEVLQSPSKVSGIYKSLFWVEEDSNNLPWSEKLRFFSSEEWWLTPFPN